MRILRSEVVGRDFGVYGGWFLVGIYVFGLRCYRREDVSRE